MYLLTLAVDNIYTIIQDVYNSIFIMSLLHSFVYTKHRVLLSIHCRLCPMNIWN